MEKEFYTAKEIIMGTRSEYQKNEKLFRMLSEMIYSKDKSVKDFDFYIFMNEYYINEPAILECRLKNDPKSFMGIIRKLLSKMSLEYALNSAEPIRKIYKDDNGRYQLKNIYRKRDIFIKPGMEKQFDILLNNTIMNSEFVTKINFGSYTEKSDTKNIGMTLLPFISYIELLQPYAGIKVYEGITKITYLPRKDLLRAEKFNFIDTKAKEIFHDEMIHQLLNFQVPKDFLSEYHRQIIDSSPSTYKPIEICSLDEKNDKNYFTLLINEEEEKITLTKAKVRKR